MARTYQQVMTEIDRLKEQAEKLRQKEVAGVVARIREAIAHYGLTAADIGFGPAPKAAAAPRGRAAGPARKKKRGGVVRFSDQNGNTWSGVGRRPQWYVDAVAAGRPPVDLLAK